MFIFPPGFKTIFIFDHIQYAHDLANIWLIVSTIQLRKCAQQDDPCVNRHMYVHVEDKRMDEMETKVHTFISGK